MSLDIERKIGYSKLLRLKRAEDGIVVMIEQS